MLKDDRAFARFFYLGFVAMLLSNKYIVRNLGVKTKLVEIMGKVVEKTKNPPI
jgi:hypothetical protein